MVMISKNRNQARVQINPKGSQLNSFQCYKQISVMSETVVIRNKKLDNTAVRFQ